jgi:glycosyltransferase involved in cell wall biosynthesis
MFYLKRRIIHCRLVYQIGSIKMDATMRHRLRARPREPQREAEVCIVIPVFNYGRYLEACLRSVLSQEDVELNVLVIDDSSTDDSLSVAYRLSEEDARVSVLAHPKNLGHIATVNEGIAAAKGEYVVKLDADDMLTEGSLKRSVALLQAFPSVGFVYGLPWTIGEGVAPPVRSHVRNWTIWPGREWLEKRIKRGTNCIRQPEAVIRLSALRQVGPYCANLPHTSDFEMWMRLATRYDVGRVNGAYQGYYREHSASMSHTVNGGLLTDVTERIRAIDSLLSEYSEFVPDVKRMRDIAHRTLAREALSHAISACAQGPVNQEEVDDYVTLALNTWHNADKLGAFRYIRRLGNLENINPSSHPSLRAHEVLRDVKYRLIWRRWRWSGT